jgi:hypothetical protein
MRIFHKENHTEYDMVSIPDGCYNPYSINGIEKRGSLLVKMTITIFDNHDFEPIRQSYRNTKLYFDNSGNIYKRERDNKAWFNYKQK